MNKILKAKIVEWYGTQADFAKAVNTDETIISRIVRGRRKLKPTIQRLWADALQCKPKDIFPDENQNSK
jgi:transcriptional regulator with XRE-family HTH domain